MELLSVASSNELIKEQLMIARQKYGHEIYNRTIRQLIEEFGEQAFPAWITRFNGPNNPQEPATENDLDRTKLWMITESFCYKKYPVPLEFQKILTEPEKQYFSVFSDALGYDH